MQRLLLVVALLFTYTLGFSQYKYEFTIVKENPATSVKNQAKTGTCWSFATTSFIESEAIRKGKADTTLNLSEMYIVRDVYLERLKDNYYRRNRGNKGPGCVSHVYMKSIGRVGLMLEKDYDGINYDSPTHDHSALQKELNKVSEEAVKEKKGVPYTQFYEVLDRYLGPLNISTFEYRGKTYSSLDFMKALDIQPNDYVEITSFSHHPFYSKVYLEIPDNYDNEQYYNVPIDDLIEIMDNAIKKGYTIAWDADVSESYFAHANKIALFTPGENIKAVKDGNFPQRYKEESVDQEKRQQMFDNFTTTDDHLMHITGIAKDQNGVKYYKVKNSWGISNGDGYLYVSENYMRAKTIAILVHKNSIPRLIRKQLNIDSVFKLE